MLSRLSMMEKQKEKNFSQSFNFLMKADPAAATQPDLPKDLAASPLGQRGVSAFNPASSLAGWQQEDQQQNIGLQDNAFRPLTLTMQHRQTSDPSNTPNRSTTDAKRNQNLNQQQPVARRKPLRGNEQQDVEVGAAGRGLKIDPSRTKYKVWSTIQGRTPLRSGDGKSKTMAASPSSRRQPLVAPQGALQRNLKHSDKFSNEVLALLQSKSHTTSFSRHRSPTAGRGGGGLGMASPKVIPFMTHQHQTNLNQTSGTDLAAELLKHNQQLLYIQKNTLGSKAMSKVLTLPHQSPRLQEYENDQANNVQSKFNEQVNDHHDLRNQHVCPTSVDNMRLRQYILDMAADRRLQTIMNKIWRCFLILNYGHEEVEQENIGSIQQLVPVHLEVYTVGFGLLLRAIEGMAIDDASLEWTALADANSKMEYIFFDRFQFDLCSLFHPQIEKDQLDVGMLEFLLRQVYLAISFTKDERVQVRRPEDVVRLSEVDQINLKSSLRDEDETDQSQNTIDEIGTQKIDQNSNDSNSGQQNGSSDQPGGSAAKQKDKPNLQTLLVIQEAASNDSSPHMQHLQQPRPNSQVARFRRTVENHGKQFSKTPVANNKISIPQVLDASTPLKKGLFLNSASNFGSPTNEVSQSRMPSQQEKFQRLKAITLHQQNLDLTPFVVQSYRQQKIQSVLAQKEINQHVTALLCNTGRFHPNSQVIMSPVDKRLQAKILDQRALPISCGKCSRGYHSTEMNYFVSNAQPTTRGQKNMQNIYDQLVVKNQLDVLMKVRRYREMVEPSKSKSERARIKFRGPRIQRARRQSRCEVQSTNVPNQENTPRGQMQEEIIEFINIEENNRIGPIKKDPQNLEKESQDEDLEEANASSADATKRHAQLREHDEADDSENSEEQQIKEAVQNDSKLSDIIQKYMPDEAKDADDQEEEDAGSSAGVKDEEWAIEDPEKIRMFNESNQNVEQDDDEEEDEEQRGQDGTGDGKDDDAGQEAEETKANSKKQDSRIERRREDQQVADNRPTVPIPLASKRASSQHESDITSKEITDDQQFGIATRNISGPVFQNLGVTQEHLQPFEFDGFTTPNQQPDNQDFDVPIDMQNQSSSVNEQHHEGFDELSPQNTITNPFGATSRNGEQFQLTVGIAQNEQQPILPWTPKDSQHSHKVESWRRNYQRMINAGQKSKYFGIVKEKLRDIKISHQEGAVSRDSSAPGRSKAAKHDQARLDLSKQGRSEIAESDHLHESPAGSLEIEETRKQQMRLSEVAEFAIMESYCMQSPNVPASTNLFDDRSILFSRGGHCYRVDQTAPQTSTLKQPADDHEGHSAAGHIDIFSSVQSAEMEKQPKTNEVQLKKHVFKLHKEVKEFNHLNTRTKLICLENSRMDSYRIQPWSSPNAAADVDHHQRQLHDLAQDSKHKSKRMIQPDIFSNPQKSREKRKPAAIEKKPKHNNKSQPNASCKIQMEASRISFRLQSTPRGANVNQNNARKGDGRPRLQIKIPEDRGAATPTYSLVPDFSLKVSHLHTTGKPTPLNKKPPKLSPKKQKKKIPVKIDNQMTKMNSDLIEAEGYTQKDANEKGESISLVDVVKIQSEELIKQENIQIDAGHSGSKSPRAMSGINSDKVAAADASPLKKNPQGDNNTSWICAKVNQSMHMSESIDSPQNNPKKKQSEQQVAYQNQVKKSKTGGMAVDEHAEKRETHHVFHAATKSSKRLSSQKQRAQNEPPAPNQVGGNEASAGDSKPTSPTKKAPPENKYRTQDVVIATQLLLAENESSEKAVTAERNVTFDGETENKLQESSINELNKLQSKNPSCTVDAFENEFEQRIQNQLSNSALNMFSTSGMGQQTAIYDKIRSDDKLHFSPKQQLQTMQPNQLHHQLSQTNRKKSRVIDLKQTVLSKQRKTSDDDIKQSLVPINEANKTQEQSFLQNDDPEMSKHDETEEGNDDFMSTLKMHDRRNKYNLQSNTDDALELQKSGAVSPKQLPLDKKQALRQKRRKSTLPSIAFFQNKPQLDNSDLMIHQILPSDNVDTVLSNQGGKGSANPNQRAVGQDMNNMNVVTQIRVMKPKDSSKSKLKLAGKASYKQSHCPTPPILQVEQSLRQPSASISPRQPATGIRQTELILNQPSQPQIVNVQQQSPHQVNFPGIKIDRLASNFGIVEDTRIMLQRRRLQDVKKYNREILAQQRKDQKELIKLSQYQKVKDLYKKAQERVINKAQQEIQNFINTAESNKKDKKEDALPQLAAPSDKPSQTHTENISDKDNKGNLSADNDHQFHRTVEKMSEANIKIRMTHGSAEQSIDALLSQKGGNAQCSQDLIVIDQQHLDDPDALGLASLLQPAGKLGSAVADQALRPHELARIPQLNQRKLVPTPRVTPTIKVRRPYHSQLRNAPAKVAPWNINSSTISRVSAQRARDHQLIKELQQLSVSTKIPVVIPQPASRQNVKNIKKPFADEQRPTTSVNLNNTIDNQSLMPGIEKVVKLGFGSALGPSAMQSQHNQSVSANMQNQDLLKVLNSLDSSDISKNEEEIRDSVADSNKMQLV